MNYLNIFTQSMIENNSDKQLNNNSYFSCIKEKENHEISTIVKLKPVHFGH